MRKHFIIFTYIAICLTAALGLYSCASTGRLTGGIKDIIPPKLDTLASSKDKQVNYKPSLLTFYFDEFVEIKDAIKQVLVSPPLTYIPKVKNRGKKVTFEFDEKEVLRENATYTINFGEAIVDFHEGNKLSNFTYVFATGPLLDSLNINGKIINAQTGEGEPEMIVLLYDHFSDSIVNKEKPFYFAKPDKTGKFTFRNIKADTFKIFALKDENLNYKYDLDNEKIAFDEELIILNDTFSKEIILKSSIPKPTLKLLSKNVKTYGKINLLFNTNSTDPIPFTTSDTLESTFTEISGDSLNIYYETGLDSFFVYILNDTIKVKPKAKQDFLSKNVFRKISTNSSNQMLTTDSLMVAFNHPVQTMDDSKFIVYDSIGLLSDVSYQLTNDHKKLIIKYPWLAGEKYTLEIDSALMFSIYGQAIDSIGFSFNILKPEKTAILNLRVVDLDSLSNYVLYVFRDKTKVYQSVIQNKSRHEVVLKGLVPDNYNIEIIQDDNANMIWDAGHYWSKKQPEKYLYVKGDKLRENRDSEFEISWKTGLSQGNEPNPPSEGLQKGNKQTKQ